MLQLYDLHTHSTASDGVLSPSELVKRAATAGIYGLALTDHDTIDGLDEAELAAGQVGVKWIPGVEISVTWNFQTIHIVGLWINLRSPELIQGLTKLREFRVWRAEEIGRRLAKSNIPNAFIGACKLADGKVLTRTHFAKFLIQQGFATNEQKVFESFLTSGKPGYVTDQWATMDEAINWIKLANGKAVLAHPSRYKLTYKNLRRLISVFKETGGLGLEVISRSHTPENVATIARLANEFELLSSIGSDFHNPYNRRDVLGQLPNLPLECTPIWQ